MTIEETAKIISILTVYYKTDKTIELLAKSWHMILGDASFVDTQQAVMSFVNSDTKGYFPVPGMIRAFLVKKNTKMMMTQTEAWGLVMKAIQKSTYYSQEAFEELPVEIQKAIGSHNYLRTMAITENLNWVVEECNFSKSYNTVIQRETEKNMLPLTISENMLCYKDELIYSNKKADLLETTQNTKEPANIEKINSLVNNLRKSLCIS